MTLTGAELSLIITAAGTLITCIGNVLVSLRNSRKIEEVHLATNSMKDALVDATAKASRAEGVAVGLAKGRAEKT